MHELEVSMIWAQGLLTPVMSKELFAVKTGLRPDQVRGQIARTNIPTIKFGRLQLINLAQMAEEREGIAAFRTPVMTAEKFAALIGVETVQIQTQLTNKTMDHIKVGRLIMVDICALYRRCLASPLSIVDSNNKVTH